jgi:hypothetical protein
MFIDVYNSLPGTVIGAAGAGLVGRILFGAGPAGAVTAALYVINEQMEKLGLNIGNLPKKAYGAVEALRNIQDVVAGKKDWQTGLPTEGPFQGGGAGKKPSGAGGSFPDPDIASAAARAAKKKAEEAAEAARAAAEKFAKDMEKIGESAYQKEMGLFEDLERENAKYIEEMNKEREKQAEDLYLSEMERFENLEKENADYFETARKLALERFQMERDVYEDLRGYEKSYYDAAVRLIQEQARRYREAGVDEVAVAVWVRQEIVKENIRKGKSSEEFVDGWRSGLEEMRRDSMTWGQAGYETFKSFADRSRGALSDVLFDGMKGQMKSFEDYWQSFADSMLRSFTDICAKMLVEWMLTKAKMTAAGGLSSALSFLGLGGGSLTSLMDIASLGGNDAVMNMMNPMAKGAAFHRGRVTPFADGGVVDRPTAFPMLNGMGLMGEKGPEAIMPLKRLPGGRLGVEAQPAGNLTISVPVTLDGGSKRLADRLQRRIERAVQDEIKGLM